MTDSIRQLIQADGNTAMKLAYRLMKNRDDTEEMVQEALYRIIKKWNKFDPSKPMRAWFFAILHNTCIEEYKRGRRRLTDSIDENMRDESGTERIGHMSDGSLDMLDDIVHRHEIKIANTMLASLPINYRKIMLLYCNGLQYDIMAKNLKIPIGSVKSRLSRAKKLLRNFKQVGEM